MTTLTEQEIKLIKDSWGYILTHKSQAGELFYKRLFELAPQVEHLFKEDSKEQAAKLVSMITIIVAKLNKLEDVLTEVGFLARKHIKYGAVPEHYAVVGECLIWTLEKGLGNKWNQETAEAWTKVYGILSEGMISVQNSHKS